MGSFAGPLRFYQRLRQLAASEPFTRPYAAHRTVSSLVNQPLMRFQLVNVRVTSSTVRFV
jgi:hypothetical protein